MTHDRNSAAQPACRSAVARRTTSARLAGGVLVVLGLLGAPAGASEDDMPAPGRFDMHPSPDGVLRLDRLTGEIALCATGNGAEAWTCRTVVAGAVAEPVPDEPAAAPAQEQDVGNSRARADGARERIAAARERAVAARERALAVRGEIARRLPREAAPDAPAVSDGDEVAERDVTEGSTGVEIERLRQENARLTARVDELERRLTHVAALSGTDGTQADAETDEALADIDRALRVGIYALARFRDLAEALGSDEPPPPGR